MANHEFDAELFYKLCKEYGVEFSNEYGETMITLKSRGTVPLSSLSEEEFKQLFFGELE